MAAAAGMSAAATVITPPLVLQPWQPADVPALFSFLGDAQAMRSTHCSPSEAACAERLARFEQQRRTQGFAPWVVRERAGAGPIGWGGLCIDADDPAWGIEVAYAFHPVCWGRGYASGVVRRSLAEAFGALALKEVNAFVMPANSASARVLQKCGFQFLRHEGALERDHYRIARP